jgi:hypothetical protein
LFQFLTGIVHLRLKQTPDPVARDQLAWGLEVIRAVSLWRPLLEAQSIRIETNTERLEFGSDLSSSPSLIVQGTADKQRQARVQGRWRRGSYRARESRF